MLPQRHPASLLLMTIPSPLPATFSASQLNQDCRCALLDRERLHTQLSAQIDGALLFEMISEQRPYLLSDSAVFVDKTTLSKQQQIIEGIERVIALPGYQQRVLQYAPQSAQFEPYAQGVFLGYDFHLSENGPRLIEINTNAGGALLNATLAEAYAICGTEVNGLTKAQQREIAEHCFIEMFLQEWHLEKGQQALKTIAIVDQSPATQYLLPEFLLFRNLFARHGIQAWICDPSELEYHQGSLSLNGQAIDLVYNRLTDFALQEPAQQCLLEAFLSGSVVVTPHPRSHALYADKRNLCLLTDLETLNAMGVDPETRDLLLSGIAHTTNISSHDAEALWQQRKQLFFKPARGYGSKASYRGDKLTRGVFSMILQEDYVAQTLIQPSLRRIHLLGEAIDLKLDLRHYVYQQQTQWLCARLYQGQTTNFRTPGGGFAPVIAI